MRLLKICLLWSLSTCGQDGPVAPGTATDCTFYDTAYDNTYTCSVFEDSWGLSHADFVDYNPSVKADCSGIKVGNSYCVEVNYGLPRPTTKPAPSSTTTTLKPTETGPVKPSPTQEGLIKTCTKFYRAVSGDDCNKITTAQGNVFTLAEFVSWNPAVKSDCSGLWADTYYCVGIPGTPTKASTTEAAATSKTSTKPAGPTPTQDKIASNCQRYHLAKSGDSCQKIVDQYGTFTLAQFYSWNPAVGSSCSGLWVGYYYCIGIPGTPTKKPTSTTTKKPPANTCNPAAPTPTQPKPICGCKKWHKVSNGNTCDTIIKQYKITKANFNKWNPDKLPALHTLVVTESFFGGVPEEAFEPFENTLETLAWMGAAGDPGCQQPIRRLKNLKHLKVDNIEHLMSKEFELSVPGNLACIMETIELALNNMSGRDHDFWDFGAFRSESELRFLERLLTALERICRYSCAMLRVIDIRCYPPKHLIDLEDEDYERWNRAREMLDASRLRLENMGVKLLHDEIEIPVDQSASESEDDDEESMDEQYGAVTNAWGNWRPYQGTGHTLGENEPGVNDERDPYV
ncbi:hypothetical protein CkaCkLH20_11380 [Colletotrichum karsti]|uniref:LysM domain-containing protein n=1 Tax=Colletotrichum karsti TaxID=1095194 RepID=A0A9P6HY47_9PEZI|nr:uncharacterized protein CkaCkLH20_11380 [Colletotrichum karsti]KAF9871211.1 hypothetical protein CkaCkLH20_11380 [Colletotrichum karsti]